MLLRLSPDFNRLSIPQLYEKFGTPVSLPVVRLDRQSLSPGVPLHGISQVWLGKASDQFSPSEVQFLLKDFGESYNPSVELRDYSNTHLSLVPPEAHFEEAAGLSFPADIWSLACAIWAILGQRPLFKDISATIDDITAEQIQILGNFPQEWWEKWEARSEYFNEMGELAEGRRMASWLTCFEDHIEAPRREVGLEGFDLREKNAIINMLRAMLVFKPEKRLTAGEILRCEWMMDWALPEFERSGFGEI